jgi:hypothetical protein
MGVLMPGMHPSVGGADSGTIYFFEINFPTSHPKQFQLPSQRERINSCGDQRTKNHVAAGSGKTIEVESFHWKLFSRKKAQRAQKSRTD